MRNELPKFGYLKPTSVSDAVSLLTKYGGKARVIAGGTDLMDQMKDGLVALTPEYVVDINGLGLNNISFDTSNGLTVGATASPAAILADSNVATYYGSARRRERSRHPDSQPGNNCRKHFPRGVVLVPSQQL